MAEPDLIAADLEPATVALDAPDMRLVPLDSIRPYWRNPRKISESAVEAVADSIRRYGYQQPIVVDTDDVIITGHTRYAALRKLGVDEVPVLVAHLEPEKAREYRVLDNRVAEYSAWDMDSLVLELREFEDDLLTTYFPEVDLEVGEVEAVRVSVEDVRDAEENVTDVGKATTMRTVEVVCPSCFHSFEINPTEG